MPNNAIAHKIVLKHAHILGNTHRHPEINATLEFIQNINIDPIFPQGTHTPNQIFAPLGPLPVDEAVRTAF